jgi:predicted PurR-regulated permease PerM
MDESERAFVRRLLITLAVVVLALALWQVRLVLLLILAGVLVAVLLDTIANAICHWTRLPRKFALPSAVLGLFAAVVGAGWLFGAEATAQVRVLIDTLPDAWRGLQQRLGDTVLGERLQDSLEELAPSGSAVLSGAGSVTVTLTNAVTGVFLALVGGIYLAGQPDFYRAGVLKLTPRATRPLVGEALNDSARALRLWLLGQGVSMALIGVSTGVGLALLGVPSALALGILAGLAAFVPFVGPVLAAIPALLIALNEGNDVALFTLVLYIAVQQIESYIIAPLVHQRVAALPAAVTLFAIVAAGVLFGAPGILLAAPLTVVTYVLVKRLYVREALDTPTTIPGERQDSQRADGTQSADV